MTGAVQISNFAVNKEISEEFNRIILVLSLSLIHILTQEDFGNKVGLSPVYVSSIENGHKVPKFKTFIRILNVLQINADSVLTVSYTHLDVYKRQPLPVHYQICR